MGLLGSIRRFFFQKATNDFDANEAFRRNQLRYNALYALDPDVLVRHLSAFERGDICGLERVLDEFELREDKMKIGAFKMAAAVSSKPWEVRIRKGEEENPRAKVHQRALTRFWNRIETTDAFCRNRKGGIRLLVKQMMSAQSRVYSVHDICWKVNGDGTLSATFTHVPAWCFENRTGRLRYIRDDGQTQGEEMRDGEWLVTVGEGVGIPSAILAMAKRLSWNDWLLFSEKCGMPAIIGKTAAQRGTPAWDQLARAIRAVAPKTGLVADTGSDLSAVPMGSASGTGTYRELVDTVDRAISSLYRGGDLATMSSGPDSAGVNAQDGESELMDGDGCAMVSETLRDQVEKFVIRFECGDFEPLAEIVINPPAETEDIDREIKIDSHLARLGVKLSKADALARYGRTEAADEKDALEAPKPVAPGPFGALPNEAQPKTPLQNAKTTLQNAPKVSDGQGEREDGGALLGPFLRALQDDCKLIADEVEALLKDPTPEKAKALLDKIPDLVPEDPALAPLLAEEMAKAYGEAWVGRAVPGEPLSNGECRARDPAHCPTHGTPRKHRDKGFQDRYGNGNPETLAANPEMNIERGKAVFTRLARKQTGDEPHAMYRNGLGWIGVEAGTAGNPKNGFAGGSGIAHILAKHGKEGITAEMVAETLQHGEMYRNWEPKENRANERKVTLIRGNNVAILSKFRNGRILITDYEVVKGNDEASVEEKIAILKKAGPYHVRGRNE